MFHLVLRRQKLMDEIMEASHVDLVEVMRIELGQAFTDARSKCRFCTNETRCRAWLFSPETKGGPPEFCPNAELFRMCKRSDT
jgi:hypothetical protein